MAELEGHEGWDVAVRWVRRALLVAVAVVAVSTATGGSTIDDDRAAAEGAAAVTPEEPAHDLTASGEQVLVLPGEPNDAADLVALTYRYDPERGASSHHVARLDGGRQPVWLGPRLRESQYQVHLATDGERLFTSDKAEVLALRLVDGRVAWRAPLTDEMSWTCTACFSVVGDRLLVTPVDGELHAFDAASGRLVWQRRLEDTRAPVHVVGDEVLVIDRTGTTTAGLVLDPEDGEVLRSFTAGCDRDDGLGGPSALTSSTAVRAMPDGSVVLGYGTWPACWERRPLGPGRPAWQVALPDASFTTGAMHVTDGRSLLSGDGDDGLVLIDLDTGAALGLPAPPDGALRPVAVAGETVLAARVTTRGTPTWTLHALDRGDARIRWSHPLERGATPLLDTERSSTTVSSNERRTAVQLRPTAIDLVTLDGETADLVIQRLDPATGAAGELRTVDLPEDPGSTRFVPMAWRGDRLVVLAGRSLLEVDLAAGRVGQRYTR